MIIRQRKLTMARRSAGFSMIDALIAIVVLATGLLALAVLQGAYDAQQRRFAGALSADCRVHRKRCIDRMRFAELRRRRPRYHQLEWPDHNPGDHLSELDRVALTLLNRPKSDAKRAQTAAGVSSLQNGGYGSGSGGVPVVRSP